MMYNKITIGKCTCCEQHDVQLHQWDKKEFYCGNCTDLHNRIDAHIESEIDNKISQSKEG